MYWKGCGFLYLQICGVNFVYVFVSDSVIQLIYFQEIM